MDSFTRASLITFLILLTLTSLVFSNGCMMRGGCFKTSEDAHRLIMQVDFYICGNAIFDTFMDVCRPGPRRRKRDLRRKLGIVMDRKESHKFLRRRKRRVYDIVEECCMEGCIVEEVSEYCD
uniref:Insulin-like peptide 01 n=1 Tax=Exaiptasia diaphana TaxID=2652724 RepID=INS1_EXADI